MQWFVRFEMRSKLDEAQAERLRRRPDVFAIEHKDNPTGGRWCELTVGVDATGEEEALRAAKQVLRGLGGLRIHTEPPFRVTVEQADAPTGYDLLSTAGVAARLGVSDARVRQLAQRPDFPEPLRVSGLAGAVYSTTAIDTWARSWDRDNPGGRPRRAEG